MCATHRQRITELIAMIDFASIMFHSDADWSIKYDAIFSMGIGAKIRDAGFRFDWDDPDESYEADVTAFFRALEEFRGELNKLVSPNRPIPNLVDQFDQLKR